MLTLFVLAAAASADDWPHWRGPERNGISAERDWLDTWPAAGPKVLWSAEVGTGFSSFAVARGRVTTLGNSKGSDTVFCFDAETGKVLWSHSYPSDLGAKFYEGGPSATPAVDGDRVYTIGKWGDAFCFEAAGGKILWSKNLREESGAPVPAWGFGGSPVVLDDLLLFNIGKGGLALEKATGRLVWKSDPQEAGYSTPLPVARDGGRLVLLSTGTSYLAVEPKTGKESWRVRWVTEYGVNAADPILEGDRLFLSSGYEKGAGLFSLGKAGPESVWKSAVLRAQMNPPVLIDGHLYGVDGDTTQRARLKCIELATGSEKWAETGIGSGSVTAAGGRLLVLGAKGELLVAPVSPEKFAPTARAQILTGKCWTVPVLANGRLYARNAAGKVVCLDLRKTP